MSTAFADAIDLALWSSRRLAFTLINVCRALAWPDPPVGQVLADADLIVNVLAPAIVTPADVGAIARIVAADTILLGKSAIPGGQDPELSPAGPPSPLAPDANDAAPAFYAAATVASWGMPRIGSPARLRAGGLARALCASAEAAFLGQAFVCEANSNFADRQSAIDARNRIGIKLDGACDRIAACAGADLYDILAATARYAMSHIAALSLDLRPIVVVTTPRSAPSSVLAWELYGDPSRAGELVDRNRCGTPLFLPATFEALAPEG